MDITIRGVLLSDAETIVEIYNDAFYDDFIKYEECPAYGKTVANMEKSIKETSKYVALYNSRPVGVISVKNLGNKKYYIGCLCIIKEYQGNGIGHQLFQYVKDLFNDWESFELITPIDKAENIKFYTQKCGFNIENEEMDRSVKVYHFKINR
jgi:ribosomal protein S18 acetylase RimI-like enzyme